MTDTPGPEEDFQSRLNERRRAAEGLERDLLTRVPLLYGSPDNHGAAIVLERLHQQELIGRNGGGLPSAMKRPRAELPFERGTMWFALGLALAMLFL